MRFLLDTHIFIWYAKEQDRLSPDVSDILGDYANDLLISMESVRELILAYKSKPLLRRYWKSSVDMIDSIQRDYGVRIVQPDMEVMRTLATLEPNINEAHNDPSDHIIISQAITLGIPLISGDHKFPWYKNQGLDLIYNREN